MLLIRWLKVILKVNSKVKKKKMILSNTNTEKCNAYFGVILTE